MDDTHYMRMALQEAEKAQQEGEIPVGAIVVCNDKIIAKTHNLTQALNDVTAHAEILAITGASNALNSKYLTDCTLYVTLEPCIMCAGAIGFAQIKKLVYAVEDPKRGYSRFSPPAIHPKTEVVCGVMRDEAQEIITSFFRKKR